ncbi:MAG: 2-iminoacetate synthase ThiH [Leptospirales bacterium]|nr:2-iminoacetate synthase ThiH [Leptospirales bacterium]
MSFLEEFQRWSFPGVQQRIASSNGARVEQALSRSAGQLDADDLIALLSPAADAALEQMARQAQATTRLRFGKTVLLYAPLYLSNICYSQCTYCGFSYGKDIRRLQLSPEQAEVEAGLLHAAGIRHILLLTGEAYRESSINYIGDCVERIARSFASVSVEVYPLKTEDYLSLRWRGLDGLAIYQETYDPRRYAAVHLKGIKARMEYRLECPDRAGEAGMRRIALGALLGLSDAASDVFFTALHARYLMQRFWQTQISISLPRLRPATGVDDVASIGDRDFARFLFALRLFLPDAGLTLSTREPAPLRDELCGIVATQISAGSQTSPGGYSDSGAARQFEIEDRRTVRQVADALAARNLDPVFTDWSPALK